MIRNIIFDWSGTLVDDLPAVWKATNHVFRQAGLREMPLEEFRAEFCLPFKSFYDRYTPHIPWAQLEDWFHGHFKEVQESVCELPHAREFLLFCRQHQVRMYVLSTVHPDHFATQADVTGFGEFFDRAYLQVLDKRTKIVELLSENGLASSETLFIGDMLHDIETAKHGQVRSCAVLTGYTGLEQLRASQPDLIVEHLGELKEILQRHHWELASSANLSTEARNLPIVTVGALIFNDAGEVLMIRTHKWSDLWGIPGGKIKFGECSMDALCREIKEETALDVVDVRFVLVQDCIHSREFYRDAHFVLLNYTCRASGETRVQLNEEAEEYRWMTMKEAFKLPLNQPTLHLLTVVQQQTGL